MEIDLAPGLAFDGASPDEAAFAKDGDGLQVPPAQAVGRAHNLFQRLPEDICALGGIAAEADALAVGFVWRQVFADIDDVIAVQRDLHVIRIILRLLVDAEGDIGRRRCKQCFQNGRAEERVAVQEQERPVHFIPRHPAGRQIVGDVVERVEDSSAR